MSAACLCRPPLLPRMSSALALVLAGLAHPLTFDLCPRLCPAEGGAGQPGVALAAAQLPAELVEAWQQTRLPLPRDPVAPPPRQVAHAAQPRRTVT